MPNASGAVGRRKQTDTRVRFFGFIFRIDTFALSFFLCSFLGPLTRAARRRGLASHPALVRDALDARRRCQVKKRRQTPQSPVWYTKK